MKDFVTSKMPFLATIWLASSLGGFAYWEWYDRTPGPMCDQVSVSTDFVSSASNDLNVLLFLHPHCPCARAALNQLINCVETHPFTCQISIVFVLPPGAEENWEQGELWRLSQRIPSAKLLTDIDGILAKQAGVRTSGHIIIQDSTNLIRFSGGITRGRGSKEDCAGLRAMTSLLSGHQPETTKTPVFGCPLFESDPIVAGGDTTCP